MEASSPQWAALRSDLLSKIAKSLDTRLDVLHFRAVCFSWRSSVPPPPKTPSPYSVLKLPFPIGPNLYLHPKRRGHFLLTESTVYALQPLTKISNACSTTNTWLVKVQDDSKSGIVILKDPLSRFPFANLAKHFPKTLNLLDYRVSEISKVHGVEFVEQGKAPETEFNELKSIMIKQIVVSSSSLDKMGDGDDFAVMALHTGGKLAVYRVKDKKWTNIKDNRERSRYDNIAYHKGKFYAVDVNGLTIRVDPLTLNIVEVGPAFPRSGFGDGGQFKYLVASLADLFLVEKYYLEAGYNSLESDFDDDRILLVVHKLNEEKREWVVVDGLKDRALFIGDDGSFSVSAKDFSGCKGNSVYFTENEFDDGNDDHPGWDAGIFDLDDDTAGPLSNYPGCSKIFWPPPTWLKKNPRGHGSCN